MGYDLSRIFRIRIAKSTYLLFNYLADSTSQQVCVYWLQKMSVYFVNAYFATSTYNTLVNKKSYIIQLIYVCKLTLGAFTKH